MVAQRFPVESGHIMMFARAIGDPNPIYADPDYAATTEVGHVIAPPTFVQASAQFDPDYPLRPKIGQRWFGSGSPAGAPPVERSSSGGGSGTGLHAEQHYVYHRQVQPGDILSAVTREGRSWEREGRRGGTLSFRESITEYRDQHGELIVTARGIGVRTSRTVEGN